MPQQKPPQKPIDDWVDDDPNWQDDKPEQTGLERDWARVTTPLQTKTSEWGRSAADYLDKPTLEMSPTGKGGISDFLKTSAAMARGGIAGAVQGIGDFASEATSPLNLAVMALTGGSSLAGKAGLAKIAQLLSYGGRAASAPLAIHGGAQVINPESTLVERGMGAVEAAGGILGMKHRPNIRGPKPEVLPPDLIPESRRLPASAGPRGTSYPVEDATSGARFMGGPEGTIIDLQPINFSDKVSTPSQPGARIVPEPTQSTPVESGLPIRPPVNPAVSRAVASQLKVEPQGIEPTLSNNVPQAALNSPEAIQAAYNSKLISQEQALTLLKEHFQTNFKAMAKTIKTGKPVEPPVEPIEATTNEPVAAQNKPKTYIFTKEETTPELITKARAQGYEFNGLTDKGDYRFSKIPGEEPIATTPIEPTPPIAEPPIIPPGIEPPPIESTPFSNAVMAEPTPPVTKGVTSKARKRLAEAQANPVIDLNTPVVPPVETPKLGVPEVVELMRRNEVKTVAELQKQLGVSFDLTKVIWNKAKDVIGPKEYSTIQANRKKAIVPSIEIPPEVEASSNPPIEVPPVENTGLVVPKAKVTPAFIENARYQGYEVDGLTETGDYKFRRAEGEPPPIEIPPEPVVSKPTRTAEAPTSKTGIPVTETGNADLDDMVKSLRAMRRRKGINQLNPLEAQTYRTLLDNIKNHPDLPPTMKEMWDSVTAPPVPEPVVTAPETPVVPTTPETKVQTWRKKVAELDASNAPDIAYRSMLSDKVSLKEGDTWRAKILRFIDLAEKQKTTPKPPGFGSRFMSEKGELTIDLSGFKKNPPKVEEGRVVTLNSEQATGQNLKTLYAKGYRFLGGDVENGFRFQKSEPVGKAPILEEDVLPTPKEPKPKEELDTVRQVYDLSRGVMSVDPPFITSAAFRQAMPWVGTKNWFKAWKAAAQSFGDKAWYDARMAKLKENPLFKSRIDANGKEVKSFADEIGIRMTDLQDAASARQEGIRTQLAEKIPGFGRYIAASNRAFSGFLNDLRFNQLEAFVQDGKAMAVAHKDPMLDLTKNIPLAKEFAQFLNDTTGAGTLKTGIGKYQYSAEMHAKGLADVFFSPRLMASRIRMLNPSTYVMAHPLVRKQYTYAMLRTIGAWWGIAQLGQMVGGTVVTDPTNADFGKIKIGDTRLDPGAGFQQFLVLGSRLAEGEYTSSITGKTKPYGEGYNPQTRVSAVGDFLASKIHPTAKLFYDIGAANERQPVYLGDRIMQMYVPMMTANIVQLANEHPELIPIVIAFSGTGGGEQTYTGEPTKPVFTPMLGLEDYDIKFGGKKKSQFF